MTCRVRWFRVAPAVRLLGPLAEAIRVEGFGPDASAGFVAESVSKSQVAGAYIERLSIEDRVEDPFGGVRVYKRVEFRKTEFTLGSGFPELQVRNSPRSLRAFMSRLGELADHEVTIEPVEVDIQGMVERLEKSLRGLSVSRLVIGGFPLSPRAHADIVVAGAEDIRSEAKRFLIPKLSTVSAATISWSHRSGRIECELTRSGASCEDEHSEVVERLLRDALRSTDTHQPPAS